MKLTMLVFRLKQYAYLIRLDKPIGNMLLLWPTLWALWLVSHGWPPIKLLLIFMGGVFLMRAAGCAFNDIADKKFDKHVARTKQRPLAIGSITSYEALAIASGLALIAFLLVLQCNALTIQLALIGALLTVGYPFLKRFFILPQLGLGVAFAWGVPMAFAAVTNEVSSQAWLVFLAAFVWPLMYDTLYAMADREDDKKIGIHSSAIWFGNKDKKIIGLLQVILMITWIMIGLIFSLASIYYYILLVVGGLFIYQQCLIKDRQAKKCLQAFLNNHWVGLAVFMGIMLGVNG